MFIFPELQQSMTPEPLGHDVLESIVILTTYCGFTYLVPIVGLICLVTDRMLQTQRLGAFGLALGVLVPTAWAVYNPQGGWVFLLPVVAPAAFASFLLYVNAKQRLYHRRNPTNLIQFRLRSNPRDTS